MSLDVPPEQEPGVMSVEDAASAPARDLAADPTDAPGGAGPQVGESAEGEEPAQADPLLAAGDQTPLLAELASPVETPEPVAEVPSWTLDPMTQTPGVGAGVSEPDASGHFDLAAPEQFLNRELTWLLFNFRVLHEAEDERVPLLERIKFISIVGSNFDEFVMKRIGGLKQQVGAGIQDTTMDGRTPQQQIDECNELLRELDARLRGAVRAVSDELRKHDISITDYSGLTSEEQAYLRECYFENIFPLVTPQATDPAHPFPFISNLSLNLLATLRYPGDENTLSLARVKVPVGAGIPRLLRLKDRDTFVPLEAVMVHNLDLLFPGMEVESCFLFRVTRNANTERDEEHADDLLALIETELRDRKFAPIVRLEVEPGIPGELRGMLSAELGLDEHADVFEIEGMMALRNMIELTSIVKPALHDPPHHPLDCPALRSDRTIFHIIRERGSILLHHPYESFATSVERFLKEASSDPKVRAIKITLYRTSAESKAIGYLVEAAQNGKQVTVVVELKARFDERANIGWANRLEEAGINVTYGVVGLKTHCKTILVVRQDYDGLRRYAHIGTGNYHAETARLYSDLGLLTCDDDIGRDLTELLNYLTTGYKPKRHYEKIRPAPKLCKQALIDKIAREIVKHATEAQGHIRFKVNALEDPMIIKALYVASQAGVKIELIVRDSCCLRPGVPGLSENIRVIGIVGRFLEHARVFYFRNGGEEEYYIGSPDCMSRNLDSRVELLVPVENPSLREELRFLLDIQLSDPRSAWEMQPDGSYMQRRPVEEGKSLGSQQVLIARTERRLREVTRLRRRKPRGVVR